MTFGLIKNGRQLFYRDRLYGQSRATSETYHPSPVYRVHPLAACPLQTAAQRECHFSRFMAPNLARPVAPCLDHFTRQNYLLSGESCACCLAHACRSWLDALVSRHIHFTKGWQWLQSPMWRGGSYGVHRVPRGQGHKANKVTGNSEQSDRECGRAILYRQTRADEGKARRGAFPSDTPGRRYAPPSRSTT